MSTTLVVRGARRNATWLLPAFVGACALAGRPATKSPAALLTLYGLLAAAALSAALYDDDARPLPTWLVLGAGALALLAARAMGGIGIPARAGALALTLNVAAAIAEEAFFRRFLYARLSHAGGPTLAVLGSAALFALVHVPAYGLASLPLDAGAGLLLSWQRWASGRWEVPAATHVFANVLSML